MTSSRPFVARMWEGVGIDDDTPYLVYFLGELRVLVRAEAYDDQNMRLEFRDGEVLVVPDNTPVVRARRPVPLPSPPPRRNPSTEIDPRALDAYEQFHGVAPRRVDRFQGWTPGEMVEVGVGVDIGYKVKDSQSSKGARQPYVHDFGSGVTVYRRAKRGETPDRTWRSFPTDLMVLGSNIGFTYRDDRGKLHEVKGSSRKRLATTPDRYTLAVVTNGGVEYVMQGGAMHVSDWIHD